MRCLARRPGPCHPLPPALTPAPAHLHFRPQVGGYESDDPDDPWLDDGEGGSVTARWRRMVAEASGDEGGGDAGAAAAACASGADAKAKDLQFLFLAMTEEVGGATQLGVAGGVVLLGEEPAGWAGQALALLRSGENWGG